MLWLSLPALWDALPEAPDGRLASLAGLVLCLAGQALRAYVRGVVPADTSAPTLRLGAGSLNTAGAYRFTRNPLYLGNLLLCAGLLLQVRRAAPLALGLGFFFVEYFFVIRAEEDFLRGRFGESYERWAASVPRFFPRLTPAPAAAPALPFDAARALRAEHNPAMAWLTAFIVLRGLRATASAPAPGAVAAAYLAGLSGLALAYLGVKGWKRGWWAALRSP